MINKDPRMSVLNKQVTSAIFRAERLGREAQTAFVEVCRLETEIAAICPADTVEGIAARRGAVTAALSAGLPNRAIAIAKGYLSEPVKADVWDLLAEAYVALHSRNHP